jgi:hypothetical protein
MKYPRTQDGGLSPTLEGAIDLLCGGDVEDALQPWCGCDEGKRSPRVALFGRGEAEAPLPA